MELFFYFFIFLFGLIIGSFLNVVIFRLESGEQMVSGRSHCQHCRHTLEWYDLVPVFSFIAISGKCRYCRKKLSLQYPLVEFITGILFVSVFGFWSSGFDWNVIGIWDLVKLFYLFFIVSVLIVIFVYDLRHYIIPDSVIYPAIFISLIYLLFKSLDFGHWNLFGIWDLGFGIYNPLLSGLLASVLAGGFFFAIVVITKGTGMGGGDMKLAFLMGLVLGWPKILAALFLAFTAGAICGIIFVIAKKKALKSAIPFGPFLVLGTFIALFWGDEIVNWYGRYLF